MQCCHKEMSNWSFHPHHSILEKKVPHFYCTKCSSHYYIDKWYTAEEWFFYINGITYQQYQKQCALEDSLHAHEQINYRNPEGCHEETE